MAKRSRESRGRACAHQCKAVVASEVFTAEVKQGQQRSKVLSEQSSERPLQPYTIALLIVSSTLRVYKDPLILERSFASFADEALRVPLALQSSDHIVQDRLATGLARRLVYTVVALREEDGRREEKYVSPNGNLLGNVAGE